MLDKMLVVLLLTLMNRLDKTKSAIFKFNRITIYKRLGVFFSDYLEITTAVIVPYGVGIFSYFIDKVSNLY